MKDKPTVIIACQVIKPEREHLCRGATDLQRHFPRYGDQAALWVFGEGLKHYSHTVLFDNGHSELAPLRRNAQENAQCSTSSTWRLLATFLSLKKSRQRAVR